MLSDKGVDNIEEIDKRIRDIENKLKKR